MFLKLFSDGDDDGDILLIECEGEGGMKCRLLRASEYLDNGGKRSSLLLWMLLLYAGGVKAKGGGGNEDCDGVVDNDDTAADVGE